MKLQRLAWSLKAHNPPTNTCSHTRKRPTMSPPQIAQEMLKSNFITPVLSVCQNHRNCKTLWIAFLIWTFNPIWQRKFFHLTTHLPCFTSGKLSSLPSGTHRPLLAKSLPSASPPWQCSEQESRGAIVIKPIRKKCDKIIFFPPRLDCCLCVEAEDWRCWASSHFGGISPNVLPLEEATGGHPSG